MCGKAYEDVSEINQIIIKTPENTFRSLLFIDSISCYALVSCQKNQ